MPKNTYLRVISTLITFLMVLAVLPISPVLGESSGSELLLRFKPGVSERTRGRVLASLGLEVVDEIPEIQTLVIRVPQNVVSRVKSALSHNPMIDFVEENFQIPPEAVPNDYYFSFQWHLRKIEMPAAWDISIGNPNIIVAILDSGVDSNHPDLASRLLSGWNFYDNNDNIMDYTGHGTAVAGTAAAITNNSIGVTAPAWESSMLPVRVTSPDGYTTYSMLSKGLTYAADRGAKAATVSFGIYGGSALSSAAKYFMDKGGLVFAAGGNTGTYVSDPDNPYVISVSGTKSDDSSWGTYGPFIDLSAPCSAIYTTIKGGGYGNVGGTSFSAPLAAGVAALVFATNSSLTPIQVEHILESTAVDLGDPGYDIYYGWGRINASAALREAVCDPPSRDITPPRVVVTSPLDGSTVSGSVNVSVDASDDVAVSKVELYKDGSLFATDVDSPWEFYWDTACDSDGFHTLVARAYDTSNNVGESNPVKVNVSNVVDKTPPAVSINYPLDGAKVSGFVDISASATDDSGISKVEFYIDGRLKSTVYAMPYVYRWKTRSVKTGWHTISVRAYDSFGNFAEASVKVYVSNRK